MELSSDSCLVLTSFLTVGEIVSLARSNSQLKNKLYSLTLNVSDRKFSANLLRSVRNWKLKNVRLKAPYKDLNIKKEKLIPITGLELTSQNTKVQLSFLHKFSSLTELTLDNVRIEGCFSHSIKKVRLSNCEIDCDFKSSNLERLELLCCKNMSDLVNLPCLSSLVIVSTKVIPEIQYLFGLRELTLEVNENLISLPPLGALPLLEEVKISRYNSIRDLEWLRDCLHLKKLTIDRCRPTDFSALASCNQLTYLRIIGSLRDTIDLASLSECVNLKQFYLFGHILSVDFLSNLINLEILDLDIYEPLLVFPCLKNCINLTKVSIKRLSHNFTFLASLPNLTQLYVGEECVETSLKVLSKTPLTKLKLDIYVDENLFLNSTDQLISLSFNYNTSANIATLNLSSLRKLVMKHYSGKNIDFVANIPLLEKLVVSECYDLVNINATESCVKLKKCILSNMANLADINSLTGLIHLEFLSITDCPSITSVRCLSNLIKLKSLSLYGCDSVTDLEYLPIPILKLDLRNCPLPEVTRLVESISRRGYALTSSMEEHRFTLLGEIISIITK